jgi:hypothetical protein
MPALSPAEKLRRKLEAEHRSLSEREIVPVIQERVPFPADILALVHENGLGDLRIGDIWPKGSGRQRGRRGPEPGAGAKHPSKEAIMWDLKPHKEPVRMGVVAEPYPDVTHETLRVRLRDLQTEGFVTASGRSNGRGYMLTPKGRMKVSGRRPRGLK